MFEELKKWVSGEIDKAKLDAEIATLTSFREILDLQLTTLKIARDKM